MDHSEVEPTPQMLLKLYNEDRIESRKSIHAFIRLLMRLQSHYSISINGPWGSGKTFFVKQTKMILDALNPNIKSECEELDGEIIKVWNQDPDNRNLDCDPIRTFYFDAWEHDDEEDPVLSIVYDIIASGVDEKLSNDRSFIDCITSIATAFGGVDIRETINSIKGKDDLVKIKEQKNLQMKIRDFFEKLKTEKGNKLVFFIDELDRCSPTYAVRLLERIKHYMCMDNIVFVFAINQLELQKTIQSFYGEGYESCRYLDRFFNLKIGVPTIDMKDYLGINADTVAERPHDLVCFEMIDIKKMSMREASHYMELVDMATSKYRDLDSFVSAWEDGVSLSYRIIFYYLVPIVLGLRLTELSEYSAFVHGESSEYFERIVLCNALDSNIAYLIEKSSFEGKQQLLSSETKRSWARSVYNSVFVTGYANPIRVGDYVFEQNKLNKLVRETVNLISENSTISF